jgi:putative endonuclease
MYYVYLIKSLKYPDQTYIGHTDNLHERLETHNSGGSVHTSNYRPWELISSISFKNLNQAIAFEKYYGNIKNISVLLPPYPPKPRAKGRSIKIGNRTMIKFLSLSILSLSLNIFVNSYATYWYRHKDFIPSEQCCRAGRNAENDYNGNDEVNCRIKCMIAGYKKVYWGTKRDLSYIAEEFLPLERLGIYTIQVENGINFNKRLDDCGVILYTCEGKSQALMLEKYEHIFARKRTRNPSKDLNHYLIGVLLNYRYEDIEYFYTINKITSFTKDKEKAERFLKKHADINCNMDTR